MSRPRHSSPCCGTSESETPLRDARERLVADYAVSRETLEKLTIYERLLVEWSGRLSLVGRGTLDQIWSRHFLDSAQLVYEIGSRAVLDMGTGAGFPGMVLSIMGVAPVHLADNNQQKIAFLQRVALETGAGPIIHNAKVEALPALGVRVVTSRALAPLTHLLALAERFFVEGAEGLFPKGRKAAEEIAQARKDWSFDLEVRPSVTAADSSVLHLKRISRKT